MLACERALWGVRWAGGRKKRERERRSPAIYIVYSTQGYVQPWHRAEFFGFKSSIYFFLCKRDKSEMKNETQECLNNLIFLANL